MLKRQLEWFVQTKDSLATQLSEQLAASQKELHEVALLDGLRDEMWELQQDQWKEVRHSLGTRK